MKELLPSVWVYEQQFVNPSKVYKTIENLIESNISLNWKWAKTGLLQDSLQDSYRTNQEFSITAHIDNPSIKELDNLIFQGITDCVKQYSENYKIGTLSDEGYNVLKYENGTHYKAHFDCGGAHSNRVVSILVYLNDDYVGGELEFTNFNFKYKPKAGDIILFPSNYTFEHTAHPVTEGIKYCVVSWMAYGN